jgi:hypothetical protein
LKLQSHAQEEEEEEEVNAEQIFLVLPFISSLPFHRISTFHHNSVIPKKRNF